jgi:hypothetical protein
MAERLVSDEEGGAAIRELVEKVLRAVRTELVAGANAVEGAAM